MGDPLFRIYEPFECGPDGYPHVWHNIIVTPKNRKPGVKHIVRARAGDRCQRCGHPYKLGTGIWGEAETPPVAETLALYEDDPEGRFIPRHEPGELPPERRAPLWSACDEQCTHLGEVRVPAGEGGWVEVVVTARDEIAAMVKDGTPVQAAWRILTVHHLNGRKHDLRWWNLAALCQRCHLYIQRKVVMERVFPFEHSEWFKIHAAGWYAYAYHGEDLTREETQARLGDLLSLEWLA